MIPKPSLGAGVDHLVEPKVNQHDSAALRKKPPCLERSKKVKNLKPKVFDGNLADLLEREIEPLNQPNIGEERAKNHRKITYPASKDHHLLKNSQDHFSSPMENAIGKSQSDFVLQAGDRKRPHVDPKPEIIKLTLNDDKTSSRRSTARKREKLIQKSFSDPFWMTSRAICTLNGCFAYPLNEAVDKRNPKPTIHAVQANHSPRNHLSNRLQRRDRSQTLPAILPPNICPAISIDQGKVEEKILERKKKVEFSISIPLDDDSKKKQVRRETSPRKYLKPINDVISWKDNNLVTWQSCLREKGISLLHQKPLRTIPVKQPNPHSKILYMIYCALMKKNQENVYYRKTNWRLSIHGRDALYWTESSKARIAGAIDCILTTISNSLNDGHDIFEYHPPQEPTEIASLDVSELLSLLNQNVHCQAFLSKNPSIQQSMISLSWRALLEKPARDSEGIMLVLRNWESYMLPFLKGLSAIQGEMISKLRASYLQDRKIADLKPFEIYAIIEELGWKHISGNSNYTEVTNNLEKMFREPEVLWIHDKRCQLPLNDLLERTQKVVPKYLTKIQLIKSDLYQYIRSDPDISDEDRKLAMSYYKSYEYKACIFTASKKINLAYTNTFENFTSGILGLCALMQNALTWRKLKDQNTIQCEAMIAASLKEPIEWELLRSGLELYATLVEMKIKKMVKT